MKRTPPWLSGLVATLQGVRELERTRIFCRGRLCLILIDTVFETGCHVYLRHVVRWKPAQLSTVSGPGKRKQLLESVKSQSNDAGRTVPPNVWDLIDECHEIRNRLAHESPNEDVSSGHVNEYFDASVGFLNVLFAIDLADIITMFHVAAIVPSAAEASFRGLTEEQARQLILATQECYAGLLDNAVARLNALLNDKELPEAHYLLAICYKRKGRSFWKQAVTEVEIAAQSMGADSFLQLERADLLGRVNRPSDSMVALEHVTEADVDLFQRTQVLLLRARALRGLCRFRESLACYREAVRLGPAVPSHTVEGFIEVLINLGEFEEALALVNAMLGREPRNSYAHVLRARVSSLTGHADAAFADLDTAWALTTAKGGPGDNRVVYTRAAFLLKEHERDQNPGKLAVAEKEIVSIMESVSKGYRPRFRNLLVRIYWAQERHELAFTEACASVNENPFEERNYQHKAFAALSLCRWDDAVEAGNRGLSLAGQLVLPRILCGAGVLLGHAFSSPNVVQTESRHREWVAELEHVPEFRAEDFGWTPVRDRLRARVPEAPHAARGVISDVIDRLTASPNEPDAAREHLERT